MIKEAKIIGPANDYSVGEVEGLSDLTRSDAELLNAMSGEDFDNAVFRSGMGENSKQEYAAFKDEFLTTDWVAAWKDAQNDCGKYSFESANMGTVEFMVVGEYCDDSYDFSVCILGTGASHDFYEVDGGGVYEMFDWIMEQEVKFESNRSLWYNVHYVASVMIDGDADEYTLLDKAANLTDKEIDRWREYAF